MRTTFSQGSDAFLAIVDPSRVGAASLRDRTLLGRHPGIACERGSCGTGHGPGGCRGLDQFSEFPHNSGCISDRDWPVRRSSSLTCDAFVTVIDPAILRDKRPAILHFPRRYRQWHDPRPGLCSGGVVRSRGPPHGGRHHLLGRLPHNSWRRSAAHLEVRCVLCPD